MLQIGHTKKLKENYQIIPSRGKYAPVFEKIMEIASGEEFTLRDSSSTAKELRSKLSASMAKYPEFLELLKKEGVKLCMFTSENKELLHIRKVEIENEK